MTFSGMSAQKKDSADMTVLVTGASGLLGLNFSLALHNQTRIVGVSHHTRLQNTPFSVMEADLTDRQQVENLLEQVRPDVILNCAALANLDRCEEDPELARRMNADLPGWLAGWTHRNAAGLVHISTDAVFDGAQGNYGETDAPNPLGRYAVTKLEGEQRVLSADPHAAVCRVNFYGCSPSGKRSLVEFFYNNLSVGNVVNGFTDVLFCPLYVQDLSEILWKIMQQRISGLYHVVSSECLSKYGFGMQVARTFGFDESLVKPASWKDAGLKSVRSPDLRLRVEKIQEKLNQPMPGITAGLMRFREAMQAGQPAVIKSYLKTI